MTNALVYVVDDDDAVRDSLKLLLESVGLQCEAYASAADFLVAYDSERHGCLVADIRMPGLSGLELQERLNEEGAGIPLIFITGHGDVPMAVHAMQAGARDFLQKPFRDQELLDRIHKALQWDLEQRRLRGEQKVIHERLKTLTPRENEVMHRVVRGQANKVIAMDLGVSQRTIELHRGRVMRKLRARSVADLVNAVNRYSSPDQGAASAAASSSE